MLKFIEPMYASAVAALPEGEEWLYEVKLDGYRCLAGQRLPGRKALVEARKLVYVTVPDDRPRVRSAAGRHAH